MHPIKILFRECWSFRIKLHIWSETSENVRKRSFSHVPLTKTQIILRIPAVWSESSLSAWRNFKFLAIQNAPGEDSDQIARMRRLIWIFAGRTSAKVCFLTLQLTLFESYANNNYAIIKSLFCQFRYVIYNCSISQCKTDFWPPQQIWNIVVMHGQYTMDMIVRFFILSCQDTHVQ